MTKPEPGNGPEEGNGLSAQRVRYLECAYDLIREHLLPEAPSREQVALAYSFPTQGVANGGGGTIGQCIYSPLEGSAALEQLLIIVHPSEWSLDLTVLAVLAHEMAHAATPGAGHVGRFVQLIRRIGLDGRPTATVPGSPFKRWVERHRPGLPCFPAGSLTISRKVQGTRNRLWECGCEPAIKVRTARDTLPWVCTICGQAPVLKSSASPPRRETTVLGRPAERKQP